MKRKKSNFPILRGLLILDLSSSCDPGPSQPLMGPKAKFKNELFLKLMFFSV